MKTTYILGIDAAKHKIRAALRGAQEERCLFEKDLPVSAAGLRELLAQLKERVPGPRATAGLDRSDRRAPSPLECGAGQSGLCRGGDQSAHGAAALHGGKLPARQQDRSD